MIVIVSRVVENNLVYFRDILTGSMIVSWAIENNLVFFFGRGGGYSSWSVIVTMTWSYPLLRIT